MDTSNFPKYLFTALGFAVVVYIIVPLGLLIIVNIFLSAATVLDPLHAKMHAADMWGSFVGIVAFQVAFSIIVAVLIAASAIFMLEKIRSGWVYLATAGAGICIHYFVLAIVGGGMLLATADEIFSTYVLLFLMWISITGPLLGMITAAIGRRRQNLILTRRTYQ